VCSSDLIRYSLAHPETFIPQVKAILRAANHGQVRLMFPMVSQVEELDAAFLLIERAKAELIEQEKGFGTLSYGIVVETPAAVMNLPSMLPLLDFVSIGTNDLTQYTLASDQNKSAFSQTISASVTCCYPVNFHHHKPL